MGSWKEVIARAGEKGPGRTLVELLGKERLVIERHGGIQCYSHRQIRIGASFGAVCVTGEGLSLCCMSREQLCVTGRIDTIELVGRNCNGSVD